MSSKNREMTIMAGEIYIFAREMTVKTVKNFRFFDNTLSG